MPLDIDYCHLNPLHVERKVPYMNSLPYAGAFAIIPAHSMPADMRWQVVVIRGDHFGAAPCSSRAAPAGCLDDIRRLTGRYTEGEFFRALDSHNDGEGMKVSATFRAHVREMLDNSLNVLEQDIEDVIALAKRPKTLKANLIKKFKPRAVKTDWLFA